MCDVKFLMPYQVRQVIFEDLLVIIVLSNILHDLVLLCPCQLSSVSLHSCAKILVTWLLLLFCLSQLSKVFTGAALAIPSSAWQFAASKLVWAASCILASSTEYALWMIIPLKCLRQCVLGTPMSRHIIVGQLSTEALKYLHIRTTDYWHFKSQKQQTKQVEKESKKHRVSVGLSNRVSYSWSWPPTPSSIASLKGRAPLKHFATTISSFKRCTCSLIGTRTSYIAAATSLLHSILQSMFNDKKSASPYNNMMHNDCKQDNWHHRTTVDNSMGTVDKSRSKKIEIVTDIQAHCLCRHITHLKTI